jgi:hypothetical protein
LGSANPQAVNPDRSSAAPDLTANRLLFPVPQGAIEVAKREVAAASRMASIEAQFFDGVERKRLIITLTKDQKTDLANHADRYLASAAPAGFEERLRWHRHLYVLREIAPSRAASYEKAEEKSLQIALDDLDSWKKTNRSLRDLDLSMRQLHKLASALPDGGRRAVGAKMQTIEAELLGEPELVKAYVQKGIKSARGRGVEERANSQETIQKSTNTPILKYIMSSLHDRLARNPDFKSDKGKWYFQEKVGSDKKESWIIELDTPYFRLHGDRYITLRHAAKPEMFISMTKEDFESDLKTHQLGARVAEARKHAALEELHSESLKTYDFPREGKIGYLRVFPDSFDQVISATLQSSMLLSTALNHRYQDRFVSIEPIFNAAPTKSIIAEIERARRDGNGPKFFCIDIYNHGSKEAVAFDYPLCASDMVEIAKKFPDCQFAFCTLACYGGGLREGFLKELEKEPELKKRMALFLQTKPNMPNYLASTESAFSMHPFSSTNYYLHLTEALYDPNCKTFGEAVRRADLKTKEYMSLDAECILDGVLIGKAPRKATSGLEFGA